MNIVSRSAWGAQFRIPGGRHVPLSQRRFFVVHWPGGNVGANEQQVVRAIEAQHRRQGWQAAPGYNFLVGQSGTVYEGCGRDVRGTHSPPRNIDGFGICVLQPLRGNPSPAALRSTRQLYDQLCRQTGRTLTRAWHAQSFATSCPGPQLINWVRSGMQVQGIPPPSPGPPPPQGARAPAFPGRILINQRPMMSGQDVRTWQQRMRLRGRTIAVDGVYGPQSEAQCRDFQRRFRLAVDGRVGPNTWRATWERPVQ